MNRFIFPYRSRQSLCTPPGLGRLGTCRSLYVASALLAANCGAAGADPTLEFELEEIVVTARRQSENLQQVPIAVSAFGADALLQNQIQDLGDLKSHVPNLELHVGDAANAVIYIRGVGQIDSISFNDPGVGVYIDDVYLGRAQGSFLDVLDPQQIEVLRGPQGTLYGRNTIGGAVKFTSARPSSEFQGYADATLGNFDRRTLKLSLSGPLAGDVLMGSLASAYSAREGFAENRFTGEDDFDKDTMAWRTGLLYTPTDELSVYLSVDASNATPDHSRTPHRETPIYSVVSGTFIEPGDDPFTVDANYNDREELETSGASVTLEYERESLTLKSITSYREMDYKTHVDLDGTRDGSFGIFDFEDQDQRSQELQLIYHGNSLDVVSGLYYFKENDSTFGGAVAPDFFVFIPDVGFAPFPYINASLRDQTNTSKALYVHLDYDLTDTLGLSLGVRQTWEKKEVASHGEDFTNTGVISAEEMQRLFRTGVGQAPTGYEADKSWSDFSPKAALNYRLSAEVLLYASASKGFKSGGFNGRITNAPQPFDPEELWSYEIGFKSTLAQNRVRLNMAAFYNDYEDFQLSRFSVDPETGAFLSLFENAGKATIYGVEMELAALLNEQLSLDINLGYLNGGYDKFIGDFGQEVSDERELVNAPKWNGRAAVRYEFGLGEMGSLALSTALSYRDKTYLTVSSSEVLAQSAYTLVEASLAYHSVDEKWTAILTGQNLTDKEYREHGFDLSASPGVQLGYYGAPRTYSVNFRYRF